MGRRDDSKVDEGLLTSPLAGSVLYSRIYTSGRFVQSVKRTRIFSQRGVWGNRQTKRQLTLEFINIKDSNFFERRGEERKGSNTGNRGGLSLESRHSWNLSFAVCIRFTFRVFLPTIHRQQTYFPFFFFSLSFSLFTTPFHPPLKFLCCLSPSYFVTFVSSL